MTSLPGLPSGHSPRRKPLALVILSGGGFTFETRRLLDALRDDLDFLYVRTEFGGIPGEAGLPGGECRPVLSFSTKTRGSVGRDLRAFLSTLATSLVLARRRRIDLIVAVGCSHAVPMLLAGRMLRVRTVFVESITRVGRLSNTGRLIYHCRLATMFIVQWPDLRAAYPSSRLGTIL